jgi:hypothetical protein
MAHISQGVSIHPISDVLFGLDGPACLTNDGTERKSKDYGELSWKMPTNCDYETEFFKQNPDLNHV